MARYREVSATTMVPLGVQSDETQAERGEMRFVFAATSPPQSPQRAALRADREVASRV